MVDARQLQLRVKELSAAVRSDPGSVARRLELAAALRDLGRMAEAVDLYRGVAMLYAEEGRFAQAIAVCRGILEIDPSHSETSELLATIAARRAGRDRLVPRSSPLGQWVGADFADLPAGNRDDATPLPPPYPPPMVTPTPRPGLLDEVVTLARPRAPKRFQTPVDFQDPTPIPTGDTPFPGRRTLALSSEEGAHMRRTLVPTGEEDSVLPVRLRKTVVPTGEEPAADDLDERTNPGAPPPMPMVREGTDPSMRGAVAQGGRRFDTAPDLEPPTPVEDDPLVAAALGTPLPAPVAEPAPPFPLLGDLPRAAFIELVARLKVRREPPGTWLVREGEPGDACFLIASGIVRVVKNGLEVARLGSGSFFGEFAVLADQRRHASVEVVESVELLEISRQLLDELTAAHPGVARTLRRFYRERLIETLVATAPFFGPLTAAEREAVAVRFRPRRFGRGAHIIDEGAPGGGLYLILVGEVEVVRGEPGAEVRLAALGEGSYFGEMSLLRGGVASATVRATRMTEAVQLPPRDFYEVASTHPVLWDALRTEAARRELLNHAILTGEARKSGDGVYLL